MYYYFTVITQQLLFSYIILTIFFQAYGEENERITRVNCLLIFEKCIILQLLLLHNFNF